MDVFRGNNFPKWGKSVINVFWVFYSRYLRENGTIPPLTSLISLFSNLFELFNLSIHYMYYKWAYSLNYITSVPHQGFSPQRRNTVLKTNARCLMSARILGYILRASCIFITSILTFWLVDTSTTAGYENAYDLIHVLGPSHLIIPIALRRNKMQHKDSQYCIGSYLRLKFYRFRRKYHRVPGNIRTFRILHTR